MALANPTGFPTLAAAQQVSASKNYMTPRFLWPSHKNPPHFTLQAKIRLEELGRAAAMVRLNVALAVTMHAAYTGIVQGWNQAQWANWDTKLTWQAGPAVPVSALWKLQVTNIFTLKFCIHTKILH